MRAAAPTHRIYTEESPLLGKEFLRGPYFAPQSSYPSRLTDQHITRIQIEGE